MKSSVRTAVFLSLLAPLTWAAAPLPTVTVYKSPGCGCCGKWVEHMKTSGFPVVTHDTENVAAHKARLGVPAAMGSCHTAEVGGYLIEGHVPAADVKRLLAEKPRARGLVSPGMPASAPGMDDPRTIPYEILLVGKEGGTTTYARH
ncbi:MAG: metal-binding protein [Rhodocyclales bacterium RIFCSPLOWO2_02_FULL_63_24]|nr:MAG: metal-binding protein [Rhodocyclales bacterium GWA2_65_19]OHC71089.1 MAG: metal-binding protein [Rhodocyclales bacterium RIFCSPLOWO2_02_FULL_63_24]